MNRLDYIRLRGDRQMPFVIKEIEADESYWELA